MVLVYHLSERAAICSPPRPSLFHIMQKSSTTNGTWQKILWQVLNTQLVSTKGLFKFPLKSRGVFPKLPLVAGSKPQCYCHAFLCKKQSGCLIADWCIHCSSLLFHTIDHGEEKVNKGTRCHYYSCHASLSCLGPLADQRNKFNTLRQPWCKVKHSFSFSIISWPNTSVHLNLYKIPLMNSSLSLGYLHWLPCPYLCFITWQDVYGSQSNSLFFISIFSNPLAQMFLVQPSLGLLSCSSPMHGGLSWAYLQSPYPTHIYLLPQDRS